MFYGDVIGGTLVRNEETSANTHPSKYTWLFTSIAMWVGDVSSETGTRAFIVQYPESPFFRTLKYKL